MPLTIEDGTGVDGANSYITLAEARTYAADRGVILSNDDPTLTPFLIKAADYLATKNYIGSQVDPDQAMNWPRIDIQKSDGSDFPSNEIPLAIKNAQCQLVIEQFNGIKLMPTVAYDGGFVTRERVDTIETYYSERIGTTQQPVMPLVDAWLRGLLSTIGFALKTVRV